MINKKKAGAGFAIALAMVAAFEGLRLIDYADPIGIPTACYGHTGEGVEIGKSRTKEECRALLSKDLQVAWDYVDSVVKIELEAWEQAAFASFIYNVGRGAFLRSTMLRLINQGRVAEACDQLKRWIYAGGKEYDGLRNRRLLEREVCFGRIPEQFMKEAAL